MPFFPESTMSNRNEHEDTHMVCTYLNVQHCPLHYEAFSFCSTSPSLPSTVFCVISVYIHMHRYTEPNKKQNSAIQYYSIVWV